MHPRYVRAGRGGREGQRENSIIENQLPEKHGNVMEQHTKRKQKETPVVWIMFK